MRQRILRPSQAVLTFAKFTYHGHKPRQKHTGNNAPNPSRSPTRNLGAPDPGAQSADCARSRPLPSFARFQRGRARDTRHSRIGQDLTRPSFRPSRVTNFSPMHSAAWGPLSPGTPDSRVTVSRGELVSVAARTAPHILGSICKPLAAAPNRVRFVNRGHAAREPRLPRPWNRLHFANPAAIPNWVRSVTRHRGENGFVSSLRRPAGFVL